MKNARVCCACRRPSAAPTSARRGPARGPVLQRRSAVLSERLRVGAPCGLQLRLESPPLLEALGEQALLAKNLRRARYAALRTTRA